MGKNAPTAFAGFSDAAIAFLSELALNNDREWFRANQSRYEQAVREPALGFIEAVAPGLRRISPHFVASSRRSGGSLMRIHRDVRFSRNKLPYKTNVGIQFRHELGKDVHAPGFYVHIEPGGCFFGVGIWRPDSKTLAAIRKHVAETPAAWKRARDAKSFAARFMLTGEQLKRIPRGFDSSHPLADDLRRKDFIGVSSFEIGDITEPGYVDEVLGAFSDAKPFMRFLCKSTGVAF